jgi:hypothetical protein
MRPVAVEYTVEWLGDDYEVIGTDTVRKASDRNALKWALGRFGRARGGSPGVISANVDDVRGFFVAPTAQLDEANE